MYVYIEFQIKSTDFNQGKKGDVFVSSNHDCKMHQLTIILTATVGHILLLLPCLSVPGRQAC